MKQKLKDRRVLVTRPRRQAKELHEAIEKEGGEAFLLPMIELKAMKDLSALHAAFNQLETYDWLVFTSPNAVKFFFEAAENFGVKFYFYPDLKIATVGEKTKLTLEQLGYRTNFVPIQYTAEVLAENMDPEIEGKKVLIPRSAKASDEYLKVFEKRGAWVEAIAIYDNHPLEYSAKIMREFMACDFHYLTFASPSAVVAFDANLKQAALHLHEEKLVCIGPTTAKAAEDLGYSVAAVANPHTIEGIVESIIKLNRHVQTA